VAKKNKKKGGYGRKKTHWVERGGKKKKVEKVRVTAKGIDAPSGKQGRVWNEKTGVRS